MDQMIIVEVGYRITIDLRYEDFSMEDIESAELSSSSLILKIKGSGEERSFPLSQAPAVFDEHINDITDGLGEPLPFTVD